MTETSDYLTAYANRSVEALFGPAAAPIKKNVMNPGRKIAEDVAIRNTAEIAEAERLNGLGKSPVEINELLRVWRAKRL